MINMHASDRVHSGAWWDARHAPPTTPTASPVPLNPNSAFCIPPVQQWSARHVHANAEHPSVRIQRTNCLHDIPPRLLQSQRSSRLWKPTIRAHPHTLQLSARCVGLQTLLKRHPRPSAQMHSSLLQRTGREPWGPCGMLSLR